MTAKILRGTEVAKVIEDQVSFEVECFKDLGVNPVLTIVRVGQRNEDIFFEQRVVRCAERVGIDAHVLSLPEASTQREVLRSIHELNDDNSVHGILLCRPLPEHLDEDIVRNAVDPLKDVDGITDISLAKMFLGSEAGYVPCTAQACIEILDHFGYELKGRNVLVIGRSLAVGKPIAMLLLGHHATVMIAHSHTENLPDLIRSAEIVISCVGSPKMFKGAHFTKDQVIIDVGTNFIGESMLVGDVDCDDACSVVAAITPVPGGTGTVTTSTLVKHVLEAVKKVYGSMTFARDKSEGYTAYQRG